MVYMIKAHLLSLCTIFLRVASHTHWPLDSDSQIYNSHMDHSFVLQTRLSYMNIYLEVSKVPPKHMYQSAFVILPFKSDVLSLLHTLGNSSIIHPITQAKTWSSSLYFSLLYIATSPPYLLHYQVLSNLGPHISKNSFNGFPKDQTL